MEYLWWLAPVWARGGAEARSLESEISLKRDQLIDRDDPVLSHGPVCPSSFAFALDGVCALLGGGGRSSPGCCSLSVTVREGLRKKAILYGVLRRWRAVG